MAAREIIRISEPDPLGDVTLVPAAGAADSGAGLAERMSGVLRAARPANGAEALGVLRRAFPGASLASRVAALDAMMRR